MNGKKRSRSENVANVAHLTRSAFYVSCIAYNVNNVSERDKQANMEWKNQNATEVKDQPNKMCCTDAEVREIFMRKNVYRSLGKLTPVFGSFFFKPSILESFYDFKLKMFVSNKMKL